MPELPQEKKTHGSTVALDAALQALHTDTGSSQYVLQKTPDNCLCTRSAAKSQFCFPGTWGERLSTQADSFIWKSRPDNSGANRQIPGSRTQDPRIHTAVQPANLWPVADTKKETGQCNVEPGKVREKPLRLVSPTSKLLTSHITFLLETGSKTRTNVCRERDSRRHCSSRDAVGAFALHLPTHPRGLLRCSYTTWQNSPHPQARIYTYQRMHRSCWLAQVRDNQTTRGETRARTSYVLLSGPSQAWQLPAIRQAITAVAVDAAVAQKPNGDHS